MRRVTSVTAPITGISTTYTLDADGRVTQVSRQNGGTPQPSRATYSPTGKTLTATDPNSHVTTYTYDPLDRPATATAAERRLTAPASDTLHRRTTKTPPSPAPVVPYAYDLASRLTGVSDTSASVPTVAVPGGGSGVQYTSYFYFDALNRLSGTLFDSVNAVTTPPSSTH